MRNIATASLARGVAGASVVLLLLFSSISPVGRTKAQILQPDLPRNNGRREELFSKANSASSIVGSARFKDDQPPTIISPLLKELKCGWGNGEPPPVLFKEARNTRSLIVDVGLDKGVEFFLAVSKGFEVVGFEPNPTTFRKLSRKCKEIATCMVVENLKDVQLPLKRKAGASYLIQSALGNASGEIDFFGKGSVSTAVIPNRLRKFRRVVKVPMTTLSEIIQDDVYLLKIDAQGFDPYVIAGASELFQKFNVRQLIFEVDPFLMSRNGLSILQTLKFLRSVGMICFSDRNDLRPSCEFYGDSARDFENFYFADINITSSRLSAECWEDFICINVEKEWLGPVLQQA